MRGAADLGDALLVGVRGQRERGDQGKRGTRTLGSSTPTADRPWGFGVAQPHGLSAVGVDVGVGGLRHG